MNIKLLKKVRKEYSIIEFPKGTQVYGLGSISEDCYEAKHKSRHLGNFCESPSKAMELILRDIRSRFGDYRTRKHNTKGRKIWYKN